MAALSPATAGFGACVVPSSRAESVSAESASRREGALIQPRARRRELSLRGAGGARRENGWRNEALALPGAARKQFILSE